MLVPFFPGFGTGGGGGGGPDGTRRRLYISSVGASGGGLERAMGTPNYSAFTLSGWAYVPTGYTNTTFFAGPNGTVQAWLGTSKRIYVRGDGTNFADSGPEVFSLDTWFHIHIRWGTDIESTKDCIIYINGTELGSASGSPMLNTAMNGTWWVQQDDGADQDTHMQFFDLGLFGSDVAIGNRNQSGSNWANFGVSPTVRLDGQTAADAGQDSSGNAYHFSQSAGGSEVVTSATSLPPGANP